MADSNNNEVIGFIASTVETLRDDLTAVRTQMVTKDSFEAAVVAVRGDIEQVQLRARLNGTRNLVTLRARGR